MSRDRGSIPISKKINGPNHFSWLHVTEKILTATLIVTKKTKLQPNL
jgi:hypothetical protein